MCEICYPQVLKKRSFSLISLVCLWKTALIVRNGHRDDSRRSLWSPGNVESRRNGCRFGCVAGIAITCVAWIGIANGNVGVWSRINGGGHCWGIWARDDRLFVGWWKRNEASCKLLSDVLQRNEKSWKDIWMNTSLWHSLTLVDQLSIVVQISF